MRLLPGHVGAETAVANVAQINPGAQPGARAGEKVKQLLMFAAALWVVAQASPPAWAEAPKVHVLMINGGHQPKSNFLSHLHHLQDMFTELQARGVPRERISVFSADGLDDAPDLAARAPLPTIKHLWLAQGTPLGSRLLPETRLTNTEWPGVKMKAATYQNLRAWFQDQRGEMGEEDALLIFVTDHGNRGQDELDNGTIALWNESMSVLELRALLGHLSPKQRVVMVMSQCFSGTFANTMYGLGEPLPGGNTCGFFSTRRDRFAYGCYPEGRGKEKTGHAFMMIEALQRRRSLEEAHEEVLLQDDSPDVPLRTSDVFLRDLLERDAAAKGDSPDARADELLAEQERRGGPPPREEALLVALAGHLQEPPTRRLGALRRALEDVEALLKRADEAAELWEEDYKALKKELQGRYLDAEEGRRWRKLRDAEAVGGMDEEERVEALQAFLLDFQPWAASDPAWGPLRELRRKATVAGELRYRLQKREAALLRVEALLLRAAGLALVDRGHEAHAPLSGLRRCEALAPGERALAAAPAAPAPLPALAEEVDTLMTILPSYLGVAYEVLKRGDAAKRKAPEGAVLVKEVVAGSAAARAGLQPGDVIVSSGDVVFSARVPLKPWVMTSPQGTPLPLRVLRAGAPLELTISLEPKPLERPGEAAEAPGQP